MTSDRKPRSKNSRAMRVQLREQPVLDSTARILQELRRLIRAARQRVATAVNAVQTVLYWRVGKRLLAEKLTQGRAAYGKRILAALSQELAAEFGEGFSYSALTRMARFAEAFPDEAIVVTLSQQLGWSHYCHPAGS